MKFSRNFLKVLAIISLLTFPLLASAQAFNTQDPLQGSSGFFTRMMGCGSTDRLTCFLRAILQFILAISFIVAVIFLVIGGFRYITSQGNEDSIESAKNTIKNAIIGVVVIAAAWFILTFILGVVQSGTP